MEADKYIIAALLFLIVVFSGLAIKEYLNLQNINFPYREMIISFILIGIIIYILYKLLVEY